MSSINRKLRQTALHMPELWRTIKFAPGWGPRRTNHYLALSGMFALDVSIDFDEFVEYGTTIRTEMLLATLSGHKPRIRRFDARFVERKLFEHVLAWLCASDAVMKMLEHVGVRLDTGFVVPQKDSIPALLRLQPANFPRLRSIRTQSVPTSFWTSFNGKNNITFLELIVPQKQEAAEFIAALAGVSETLMHLALTRTLIECASIIWRGPFPHLKLPQLRSLSLTYMTESDEKWMLYWFYTPALTSVSISHPLEDEDVEPRQQFPYYSDIFGFLVYRNPQLISLDLVNVRASDAAWTFLFSSLGNLTHLRCELCSVREDVFVSLADHLPRLTSLSLDYEVYITTSAMRDVLEARIRKGIRPLHSISMRKMQYYNVDEEEDVEPMRRIVPNFELTYFPIVVIGRDTGYSKGEAHAMDVDET